MSRRTLLALLALTLATLVPSRPTVAAPPPPDMKGSYFGRFVSELGNFQAADLNITLQVKRLVSGHFSMGGAMPIVAFTGKLTPTGGFNLKGGFGQNRNRILIRLNGVYSPGGNGELAILQGSYTISGAFRETGEFQFVGESNQP
jgi:hypothetical protein